VSRRDEIAGGLATVRERVSRACTVAGRSPEEVTVVVVTKTFPASDVRLLADLGVRDVGENRHQEAVGKHAHCADLGLRWHFVGAVQTNKAAAVAAYADVVHSVDRTRLVAALERGAHRADRRVGCLVQVNLDEGGRGEGRGGAQPDDALGVAEAVVTAGGLELAGVMGVAPLHGDAEKAFTLLAEVAQQVRSRYPGASAISAGMSGDLEAAIRCGATHVRVGTAILGARPALR